MTSEDFGYTKLTVGQRYPTEQTEFPDNTPHWVLSKQLVELVVFIPHPTQRERAEFQDGRVKFALVSGDHALVLAVKFGAMPWWDAPWQAVRQTVLEPALPDAAPGQHVSVVMVMVNSRTGIIEEMRATSWPTRFVRAVRDAAAVQLEHRSDVRAGEFEVRSWQTRYPTATDLVRQRAQIVVNGGPATG